MAGDRFSRPGGRGLDEPRFPLDVQAAPILDGSAARGMQRFGGQGATLTPPPGVAPRTDMRVDQEPWDVRPPDAVGFLLQGIVTVPATNQEAIVDAFELPVSSRGIIRSVVAVLVGTITAATRVRYRIKIGGGTVPGWDRYFNAVPSSSSGAAWGPDETDIFVPFGGSLEIAGQAEDATAYQLQMTVAGYSWREDE